VRGGPEPEVFFQDVGLAAKNAIGLRVESVELEVDRRPNFVQLFEEPIILRDPLAIRVDHYERNIPRLRGANKVDNLRVDGRLAAGELNDFGVALGADVIVEDLFHLFERQPTASRIIR
jgi:hypothetical protein